MENIYVLKIYMENMNISLQQNTNTELYSLENSNNIYEEENYSVFDILEKYKSLCIQYLSFIIDNIRTNNNNINNNYNKYIILRGLDTISNIFNILLNYSKNLNMTYYICQKGYYYYVEFIEQITNHLDFNLQLSSRDACMYVYKKTIFEMNNNSRKNIKSSPVYEKTTKKIDFIKNIIYEIVRHFDYISNKDLIMYNLDSIYLQIVNSKLNDETIEYVESFISISKNNEEVQNIETYFTNINKFIYKNAKSKKDLHS
jgi:hypothetical protein